MGGLHESITFRRLHGDLFGQNLQNWLRFNEKRELLRGISERLGENGRRGGLLNALAGGQEASSVLKLRFLGR